MGTHTRERRKRTVISSLSMQPGHTLQWQVMTEAIARSPEEPSGIACGLAFLPSCLIKNEELGRGDGGAGEQEWGVVFFRLLPDDWWSCHFGG